MKKITTIIATSVVVLAILLGCSVVEVGGSNNLYFPVAEGNTWVYEVNSIKGTRTFVCEMTEKEAGVYGWNTIVTELTDSGKSSIMGSEQEDGSEPFDDTTNAVVDSALEWDGVGTLVFTAGPSQNLEFDDITTPAGIFEECIRIEGEKNPDNGWFEVWFAPDVGPVHINRWDGNVIIEKFSLVDFLPGE